MSLLMDAVAAAAKVTSHEFELRDLQLIAQARFYVVEDARGGRISVSSGPEAIPPEYRAQLAAAMRRLADEIDAPAAALTRAIIDVANGQVDEA